MILYLWLVFDKILFMIFSCFMLFVLYEGVYMVVVMVYGIGGMNVYVVVCLYFVLVVELFCVWDVYFLVLLVYEVDVFLVFCDVWLRCLKCVFGVYELGLLCVMSMLCCVYGGYCFVVVGLSVLELIEVLVLCDVLLVECSGSCLLLVFFFLMVGVDVDVFWLVFLYVLEVLVLLLDGMVLVMGGLGELG